MISSIFAIMNIQHADDLLSNVNLNLTPEKRSGVINELSYFINEMLVSNFPLLVHLLYRADIDEKKLKQLLLDNQAKDAALIISELLVKRQEEKLRTKERYRGSEEDIDDAEKW
jgi:hypothetical protein